MPVLMLCQTGESLRLGYSKTAFQKVVQESSCRPFFVYELFSLLPRFHSLPIPPTDISNFKPEPAATKPALLIDGRKDINPYDVKAIGNYLKNLGQATQVLYAVKNREELAASDDLSCTPL